MSNEGTIIDILLVEDNPGDAKLVRKSFELGSVANKISHVSDGQEALDYLYNKGSYADARRPGLILLDLNLPGIDGREVLSKIKSDPNLATIPVIVMTTSAAEEDILATYKLHVNCFITKPVRVEDFMRVVKSIDDFWIGVVTLPNGR